MKLKRKLIAEALGTASLLQFADANLNERPSLYTPSANVPLKRIVRAADQILRRR